MASRSRTTSLHIASLFGVVTLLSSATAQDSPPPPAAPPASGDELPPPGKVEKLGDGNYKVGLVEFNKTTREVSFPAQVNMTEGLLEYALVTEKGKVHESLLVTKTRPLNLNIALLLLGYRETKAVLNPYFPPDKHVPEPDAAALARAQIDVTLEWEHDGTTKRAPIESWVKHLASGKEATRAPFLYTGSEVIEGQFVAEYDGNVIALYLDPTSMLNNPRKDNFNDETWAPAERIPDLGSHLTVILSPHKAVMESKSK